MWMKSEYDDNITKRRYDFKTKKCKKSTFFTTTRKQRISPN